MSFLDDENPEHEEIITFNNVYLVIRISPHLSKTMPCQRLWNFVVSDRLLAILLALFLKKNDELNCHKILKNLVWKMAEYSKIIKKHTFKIDLLTVFSLFVTFSKKVKKLWSIDFHSQKKWKVTKSCKNSQKLQTLDW